MMKVRTKDGATIQAASAAGIVRALWSRAMAAHADEREWMKKTAKRCRVWSGARIRSAKSAEEFLADLAQHGFIEFID